MDWKEYKAVVEAMLFAHGEPVSASRMAEILEIDVSLVQQALEKLRDDYDSGDRGLTLLQMEDRWQLATKPRFGEPVRKLLDTRRNTPLSQAALEVLAIIAYNQPVSRSFIEQVRGVDSSSTVSTLMEKGLIRWSRWPITAANCRTKRRRVCDGRPAAGAQGAGLAACGAADPAASAPAGAGYRTAGICPRCSIPGSFGRNRRPGQKKNGLAAKNGPRLPRHRPPKSRRKRRNRPRRPQSAARSKPERRLPRRPGNPARRLNPKRNRRWPVFRCAVFWICCPRWAR